jgi:hypothetical protein
MGFQVLALKERAKTGRCCCCCCRCVSRLPQASGRRYGGSPMLESGKLICYSNTSSMSVMKTRVAACMTRGKGSSTWP